MSFLEKIRGLNSLSEEELEALLYERRFELLGPLKIPDCDVKPSGDNWNGKLPAYDTIPTQRELHDALIGGQLPCGYQCVAHVLYPDSIEWPIETEANTVQDDTACETSGGELEESQQEPCSPVSVTSSRAKNSQHAGGADSCPTSPRDRRSFGFRTSTNGSMAAAGPAAHAAASALPRQEDSPRDDAALESSASAQKRVEVQGFSTGGRGAAERRSVAVNRSPLVTDGVVVRGQALETTARGKPVHEHQDDLLSNFYLSADDKPFQEAREKRKRLELAVKLERFREKTLQDKIEGLEQLRAEEIAHRDASRKRDAAFKARSKELKKQLHEDVSRKIDEEKAKEEADKLTKMKEADEERRRKQHHARQKKLLEEWWLRSPAEAPAEPSSAARARCESEERRRSARPKTFQQLEAEERVQRMQDGLAERPPMAPRPHDRPPLVLDLVDGEEKTARTPRPPPRPASWTSQAKMISDKYSLTADEKSDVEYQFLHTVQGAGRMARYLK